MFASSGADGSVRMFDLRSLEVRGGGEERTSLTNLLLRRERGDESCY